MCEECKNRQNCDIPSKIDQIASIPGVIDAEVYSCGGIAWWGGRIVVRSARNVKSQPIMDVIRQNDTWAVVMWSDKTKYGRRRKILFATSKE